MKIFHSGGCYSDILNIIAIQDIPIFSRKGGLKEEKKSIKFFAPEPLKRTIHPSPFYPHM